MSALDEGWMEPVSPAAETEVQLSEVADLLREARRLLEHDVADSEWVAYLQRKHDLLWRIGSDGSSCGLGELG